jgi:hypothetical protein
VTSETESETVSAKRADEQKKATRISLAAFLEEIPPTELRKVKSVVRLAEGPRGTYASGELTTPEIELMCEECEGSRTFRAVRGSKMTGITTDAFQYGYITYICSNCRTIRKTYSLAVKKDTGDLTTSGECWKFGENPAYGDLTPARVISIIGPAKDLFLKGRRCENHGLGIGAFVYYRRVVEGQRDRIIENIIKVARRIDAPKAMVDTLQKARAETRFSESIDLVKDAIPETLTIRGHNPLTLLHSALSDGLHGKSDEECLDRAHTMRLVLVELCERIGQALKDGQELDEAISKLLQKG